MSPTESSQGWRWKVIDAFISKHYNRTLSTKGQRYQKGARLGPPPPYAKEWPPDRPLWPEGVFRKMVDLLMFTPDEIWMVKAKMHPALEDLAVMDEYARLLPTTPDPYLDDHHHKRVRRILIYAEEDPQVVQEARAKGITVYLFQQGGFIEL